MKSTFNQNSLVMYNGTLRSFYDQKITLEMVNMSTGEMLYHALSTIRSIFRSENFDWEEDEYYLRLESVERMGSIYEIVYHIKLYRRRKLL